MRVIRRMSKNSKFKKSSLVEQDTDIKSGY